MRTQLLIALFVFTGIARTARARDGIVATFEDGTPTPVTLQNMTAVEPSADAAEGSRYLSVTPTDDEPSRALLRLRLADDAGPVGRAKLTAAVRVTSEQPDVELRWLAVDGDKHPLFQRRFTLKPGEQWVRIDEPLRAWRWDNRRVGDWDEVKEIALVVASAGVKRLDLDDVRFTGRATADERETWLLDLAFADRSRETAGGDGMLVATDAVDAFAEPDLQRLLGDVRRARAFVRGAFGDAVRPTDQHAAPVALLIFQEPEHFGDLFKRLGEQWRATITPPKAHGYTIQDVAASTYEERLGPRRPVYLHEAVHAIVARDLRLVIGHAPHWPLHEGIANYVQLCAFPHSIDRSAYVKAFANDIDPTGRGFFKPLEVLFAKRGTTREYAQLASVVAYLVERDRPLLAALAKGLADGQSASDVLAKHGTTWAKLQDAWIEWGRARFKEDRPKDAPIFELPSELK
jgi:hypothetical protein